MKIECDKCHAKYSIADEKVRGKTFKIRCKKCSNVIIVRDKASGAEKSAAGKNEPEPEDDGDAGMAAAWHLAIDGDTVGPVGEDEVIARYKSGEIDKETSVWREGFDDWLPLGEVDAFASLPEPDLSTSSPGLGGSLGQDDDVFSRAESEMDHAVSMSSERASSPSPRISDLTAQRNENSVLFSLDSLQQLASHGSSGGGYGGGASRPSPAVSTPATSAPSSEGSGLIDIRSMGSMFGEKDDKPLSGGSDVDDILPSFGGSGLGGLTAEPLAPEVTEAPTEEKDNTKKLIVIMASVFGVLIIGMGVVLVMLLTKEDPKPQIVEKIVQVPGTVGSSADEDKDKKDEDDSKDSDDDKSDEEKDSSGDSNDDGVAGGSSSGRGKTSGSRGSRSRSKKPSSGGSGGSGDSDAKPKEDDGFKFDDPLAGGSKKPTSGSKPKTESKSSKDDGGGGVDVDCLLDPNLPKCPKKKKGSSSSSSSSKPKAPTPPKPTGPEKLAASDIKAGIAKVKSSAKQCGSRHRASSGTKVMIRFSVTGSTGKVATATPTGSHAGTPLGNCVAAAAKKATFKKFQKPAQGFSYGFKM